MRKPKRAYVEALLEAVRKNPSKTVRDPKQLDLMDAIKRMAFEDLDRAIKRELEN